MTPDAIRRAVQSAAREAFALGVRAAGGKQIHELRQSAVTFAEELVLPIAGMAIEQAREEKWIGDHPAEPDAGS